MIIERKATLDNECYEGVHKKHGYAYKVYVDINATEEKDNGKKRQADLADTAPYRGVRKQRCGGSSRRALRVPGRGRPLQ